jgi:hypothetical protein
MLYYTLQELVPRPHQACKTIKIKTLKIQQPGFHVMKK